MNKLRSLFSGGSASARSASTGFDVASSMWGRSSETPSHSSAPPGISRSSDPLRVAQNGGWSAAVEQAFSLIAVRRERMTKHEQLVAAVGGELWQARNHKRGRSIHVLANHTLLAVLDTESLTVAVRPSALFEPKPVELGLIRAMSMPEGAGRPPAGFAIMSLWDVLWRFGIVEPKALLEVPNDFGKRVLHLRRMPKLSPGVLQVRHALLLRVLTQSDETFEELSHKVPTPPAELCHDLAALHLTRAIA